jgi:uncharacterized protein YjbJ (UPF0337 family)
MNKDQFKGTLKVFAGKAQEDLGRSIGSSNQQEMGFELQSAGKAQVHLGNIREFEDLEIHDREADKRRNASLNGRG